MSKCSTCGCNNFVANQFKKSNCSNCLHDHSHKPPAVGSTFSQTAKPSNAVPTQKKSSGSTSSPTLTRAASTSKSTGHSPSVSTKKSPTDKEDKHKKDKEKNVISTATTSIKDTFDSLGNKFTSIFSSEDKKKRTGSESGKKKREESESGPRPMVISGPTNAVHVSHLGFDAHGQLTAKNLPPEWAKFFQHLDETMKKMGQRGLTKKEMIMLMKYGTFAGTPAPGPSAATSSGPSLTSSGSFSNASPGVAKKPLPSPGVTHSPAPSVTARPSVTSVTHTPPPLPKKPHGVASATKPSASEYQLSTLQSEYKSLQSQLHTLQADHKTLTAQLQQLQAQLRDTTAKLSGAESEAQNSRQRLEQEREERSKVEKRVRELELEVVSRPSVPASGARVSQNIEALRSKFDQELKSVRAELDKEREQLKKTLGEETSKRVRVEESERSLRSQLEQLRNSSTSSTAQLSEVKQRHEVELNGVRDQLQKAVQEKGAEQQRVKQLQDEVKALTLKLELASTSSTQATQDTGRKFDQQVASLKESYGKEIDTLRSQLEQSRGEKSGLERQVTQLQSASQEHKSALQSESSERQRLQKELSAAQSELDQLRVKSEQSAGQLRAQSEKEQTQLSALNDKNRSLALQVEQLKAELAEVQQHQTQNSSTATAQVEQERRAYETQLTTLKQKLSTDMEQWAKKLESETRAKRAVEDELLAVKKELSQSQSASKSLLQDSSARQELQQKYDQLGREYSRALDKIETLEDQIAMLKEQAEQSDDVETAAAPTQPPPPPVPSLSPPPPPKAPAPLSSAAPSSDKSGGSMSNSLLDAIRQGQQLKPVEASSDMRIDPSNFKDEGVLSVLARALIDRRANMQEEEGEDNTPIDWD